MKDILLKTKGLYKYGMPLLLLFCFLSFFVNSYSFYESIYEVWGDIVVLFFCWREFYEAYLRGKCKWQKASICGVAMYCFLNILFIGNYDSIYYWIIQYISIVFSLIIVGIYIIIEEYDNEQT